MDGFLRRLVFAATEPLLELMGRVLLVSPTPSQMPYLWPVWQTNRAIAVSAYLVVITVAGVLVIGYQTVQTRYTIAELGPRLVVGFVAANLSWWGCEQATTVANALTQAVLGTGLDLNSAAVAVRQLLGSATGPLWLLLLGGAVEILLTAAVVAAMIRVGIGAVLVAAAPLALALHALPQTDGAARWWWRLYAGVLATQVGQALVLAVGLRVLTTPSALTASPTSSLLLLTGLLVIMVRIPFALVGLLQPPGLRGTSLIGAVSRVYLGYRLLSRVTGTGRDGGRAGGGLGGMRPPGRGGPPRPPGGGRGPRPGPRVPNGPRPGGGPGPGGPATSGPSGSSAARPGPASSTAGSTAGSTASSAAASAVTSRRQSARGAGAGRAVELRPTPPLRDVPGTAPSPRTTRQPGGSRIALPHSAPLTPVPRRPAPGHASPRPAAGRTPPRPIPPPVRTAPDPFRRPSTTAFRPRPGGNDQPRNAA